MSSQVENATSASRVPDLLKQILESRPVGPKRVGLVVLYLKEVRNLQDMEALWRVVPKEFVLGIEITQAARNNLRKIFPPENGNWIEML